jgi:hypothetical protein
VVTVLEASEGNLRTGSQSLFVRPYEYAEEARGLRRVPVPVWATRGFTATWRAPLPADKPPLDTRDEVGPLRLSRARDEGGRAPAVLVGRITNNLPVELQGAVLLYREKCYSLGTLVPGESKRVEPLFAHDAKGQGRDLSEWLDLNGPGLRPESFVAPSGRAFNHRYLDTLSAYGLIKHLLFNQVAKFKWRNDGMRGFDQSWRLRPQPEYPRADARRYRDEAILVARTPLLYDRAEDVSGHGATATRLWLGRLPGDPAGRPAQGGFMTQETYVRVYIPVGPGK